MSIALRLRTPVLDYGENWDWDVNTSPWMCFTAYKVFSHPFTPHLKPRGRQGRHPYFPEAAEEWKVWDRPKVTELGIQVLGLGSMLVRLSHGTHMAHRSPLGTKWLSEYVLYSRKGVAIEAQSRNVPIPGCGDQKKLMENYSSVSEIATEFSP